MRPGGGHNKGSSFERKICAALSLWLSAGDRDDLLTRNVLSGGKFTVRKAKGLTTGMPGDVMASHPLAFDFLSCFMIECKHRATLGLDKFLWDRTGTSYLGQVIALSRSQAQHAGLSWMVIARGNRQPIFVFLPGAMSPVFGNVPHHMLHAHSVIMVRLDVLIDQIEAAPLIAIVRQYKEDRDAAEKQRSRNLRSRPITRN